MSHYMVPKPPRYNRDRIELKRQEGLMYRELLNRLSMLAASVIIVIIALVVVFT